MGNFPHAFQKYLLTIEKLGNIDKKFFSISLF